jgi:fatty acid desaturase
MRHHSHHTRPPTLTDVSNPSPLGPSFVTAGAALTLVGTFLPWLRSGTSNRSSYEVFELVERLGFSPNSAVGWALRLWPLVPLLLVIAAVVQWWNVRRSQASIVIPALAAVYAGGTAAAVKWSPDDGLIRTGVGPVVTLLGGALTATGVVISILTAFANTKRPPTVVSPPPGPPPPGPQ